MARTPGSDVYVRRVRHAPRSFPCPKCGVRGQRKTTKTFRVADALLVYRRSELEVTGGVYRPHGACFASAFVASHPDVDPGGRYTRRVQQLVVDAPGRDKLTSTAVQEKLEREVGLPLLTETIVRWIHEAADRSELHREDYPWALAQALDTIALDEVDEPCAGIVFLTDPVKDLTLDFHVADEVTQQGIDTFLKTQKERGLQGGCGHHGWLAPLP